MTVRDYRCLFSGVSLLGAQTAVVLLARGEGAWEPIALPFFGRYRGVGFVQELDEGPNCQLIAEALVRAQRGSELQIDWKAIGIEPFVIEDVEGFLSLVAFCQLHAKNALSWFGFRLGFALVEANVAAALMEREAEGLDQIGLDGLLDEVLGDKAIPRSVYGPLGELPLRLRLRFGLSFVAWAACAQQMQRYGIAFAPPGPGLVHDGEQCSRWFSEALQRFGTELDLLEALDEYSQPDEEEL